MLLMMLLLSLSLKLQKFVQYIISSHHTEENKIANVPVAVVVVVVVFVEVVILTVCGVIEVAKNRSVCHFFSSYWQTRLMLLQLFFLFQKIVQYVFSSHHTETNKMSLLVMLLIMLLLLAVILAVAIAVAKTYSIQYFIPFEHTQRNRLLLLLVFFMLLLFLLVVLLSFQKNRSLSNFFSSD